MKALIIGGGDGLTARDMLKESGDAKIQIDLVDYSAEIINLAKSTISTLNNTSLSDDRLTVHVEDAWQFVVQAIKNNNYYDLIAVDLTVAKDSAEAVFHSVDWYRLLAKLLTEDGIMAVNCVSPTSTPHAYWSIFNSMLTAGLTALPYRVHLPSFSRLGYGPDWGFMLASRTAIAAAEFDQFPCSAKKLATIKNQFVFAKSFAGLQKESIPAEAGSKIFLHYLLNDEPFVATSRARWNALTADISQMKAPVSDKGSRMLPADVRHRLAARAAAIFPEGAQALLDDVLALMPALQPTQTRRMIADFIQDPGVYLEALDIRALVGRLVKRASELPARIAAELRLLQEKLIDWSGDLESLLDFGRQVVTTIAVVIILANFIAPDAAYGKGEHGGGANAGNHAGDRGRDNHGNWNRNWGRDHGRYGGWGRPGHWGRWGYGGWGWGGGYYGGGTGYQVNNYNNGQATDSQGNQYPSRSYNIVQTYGTVPDQPWIPPAGSASNTDNKTVGAAGSQGDSATTSVSANILNSAYRLGPDVDILSTGTTVVPLSDNAYLKVGPQASDLIDQKSGKTLISLYTDPALTWHIASELKEQAGGLSQAAGSGTTSDTNGGDDNALPPELIPPDATANPSTALKDAAEAKNMLATAQLLSKAKQTLGNTPDSAPQAVTPPVTGAFELFNSAWADPSGKFVILKKADGQMVYLDGQSWYSDQGKTKLAAPYPTQIKPIIASYLSDLARDSASTRDSLAQEQQEIQTHLDKLKDHLSKLQAGAVGVIGPTGDLTTGQNQNADDLVQFGTKKMPRAEAIKRLQSLIDRTQKRLNSCKNEADNLPQETEAVTNC